MSDRVVRGEWITETEHTYGDVWVFEHEWRVYRPVAINVEDGIAELKQCGVLESAIVHLARFARNTPVIRFNHHE